MAVMGRIKIIVFGLLVSVIGFGCQVEECTDVHEELIGKWQLTSHYSDIGNGTGPTVDVTNGHIIEFFANGSYSVNADLCGLEEPSEETTTGTYSLEKNEVYPGTCFNSNYTYVIRYTIEGDELTLYHPCIEGCHGTYRAVKC